RRRRRAQDALDLAARGRHARGRLHLRGSRRAHRLPRVVARRPFDPVRPREAARRRRLDAGERVTLSAGTKLGPYEILAPLGAGGMGEVWRAKDPRLARDVAVKVLPGDFLEGEERKQRFEREARLLAALNHPGIAAVYSFEEIPGSSPSSSSRHILVMELVEGETLRQRLAAGALPARKALELGAQMARALAAAHESGIVHRDFK